MKKIQLGFIFLLISFSSLAQTDLEGCADHPLFSRMPGYYILECKQNYDQLDFYDANGQDVLLEGTLTYAWYLFNLESGKTEPSYFQIVKNYANAVYKVGGKKIYEEKGLGCYELKSEGKEYRIKVVATNNSDIILNVLELEAMKQDIEASAILDELNKSGHIALYINFATGKSDIKPESQNIIDQIVEMLKTNPDLKVSIEGHTDNVGSPASNMTLSTSRANAVVAAIVAKGVAKTRLTAKGMGQTKPIADNSTEDGKAKNRRVEVVKQ
jgi:outer membrane protein OmpA-like peptidoglycan-associated protein